MSGIRNRAVKRSTYGAAILLVGAVLTVGASFSLAAEKNTNSVDDFVFGRAEALLVAINNTMISLAVDTERSSIDIAALSHRLGQLERRVADLEQQLAAKSKE